VSRAPGDPNGFLCPVSTCRQYTKPLETRQTASGLRRRRTCQTCGFTFRTYELVYSGQGAPVPDPVIIDRKVLVELVQLFGGTKDIIRALELVAASLGREESKGVHGEAT
jgi:hypothetical protein